MPRYWTQKIKDTFSKQFVEIGPESIVGEVARVRPGRRTIFDSYRDWNVTHLTRVIRNVDSKTLLVFSIGFEERLARTIESAALVSSTRENIRTYDRILRIFDWITLAADYVGRSVAVYGPVSRRAPRDDRSQASHIQCSVCNRMHHESRLKHYSKCLSVLRQTIEISRWIGLASWCHKTLRARSHDPESVNLQR